MLLSEAYWNHCVLFLSGCTSSGYTQICLRQVIRRLKDFLPRSLLDTWLLHHNIDGTSIKRDCGLFSQVWADSTKSPSSLSRSRSLRFWFIFRSKNEHANYDSHIASSSVLPIQSAVIFFIKQFLISPILYKGSSLMNFGFLIKRDFSHVVFILNIIGLSVYNTIKKNYPDFWRKISHNFFITSWQ